MTEYPVLAAGWIDDADGIGAMRAKGGKVKLTEAQAQYLLASGQIGEPAPAKADAKTEGKPGK